MHPGQTDRSRAVARSPGRWSTQPPLWVCLALGVVPYQVGNTLRPRRLANHLSVQRP